MCEPLYICSPPTPHYTIYKIILIHIRIIHYTSRPPVYNATLGVGITIRYRRPLRCRAQSVGLPWLGSVFREHSFSCESARGFSGGLTRGALCRRRRQRRLFCLSPAVAQAASEQMRFMGGQSGRTVFCKAVFVLFGK